jgi:hypothetical protein
MIENDISGVLVDVADKVHTSLGPGLLQSVELLINFNVPLIKDGITRMSTNSKNSPRLCASA